MLASSYFKIKCDAEDDWFDTILDADTKLFVDPFLIFREEKGRWADAHAKLIAHFNYAFHLVAESHGSRESLSYQKALGILAFHEPKEFCLGYTAQGTAGLGSGPVFARVIAAAIEDAIARGIENPKHFEELGILNEGIGADRISDMALNVLKRDLVVYTQDVAARHPSIQVAPHRLRAAGFDERRLRWLDPEVQVPTNPVTGGPLLFVPQRFLRDLPIINPDDWWSSYENKQLREDVNYEIMGHVNKRTIVAVARDHPDVLREWVLSKETEDASPYDLARDPKGVWQWDIRTNEFVAANPLQLVPPASAEDFFRVIDTVVGQFRRFIEDQGGWKLLWDSVAHEKPEDAAQLLFRGIAQYYCKANDVSLDAEVNLGRGAVDFKFSNGYRHRAHLEVKKLHNGKFWNGLAEQLPTYLRSDEVTDGWLLVLQYRTGKAAESRIRQLPQKIAAVSESRKCNLRHAIVDARQPKSASKL